MNWITPPRLQGQAVRVSYAVCPDSGDILKEVIYPGDKPLLFAADREELVGNFEPWNEEPTVKKWRSIEYDFFY